MGSEILTLELFDLIQFSYAASMKLARESWEAICAVVPSDVCARRGFGFDIRLRTNFDDWIW